MAVMGAAVITPALPEVARELDLSPGRVGLLLTVFTLPGVALTPVLGVLSDRLGRRRVLVPSLFLFGIAGGACALAPGIEWLLILRFLQGCGAATLGMLSVTMIGDIFSGNERDEAMGYNSSVLSIGTGTYPALGGALATLGWHYPFALPLVAIPVGLVVLFSLDNPEPEGEESLKDYFRDVRESLKDRQTVGLLCATLVTFVILYGPQITYLPILLDDSFGASPLLVGFVLSSASFTTALTSLQLGRLRRAVSGTTLVKVAFVLYVVALSAIPLMPSLWFLLVPTVIFGVAQGINLPNIFSLLAGSSSSESRGALLALNGMGLRLGQTLGPLVMGASVATLGVTGGYYAAAGLAAVMFVVAIAAIR
ncbi:MFS transporter [soil metagenome]